MRFVLPSLLVSSVQAVKRRAFWVFEFDDASGGSASYYGSFLKVFVSTCAFESYDLVSTLYFLALFPVASNTLLMDVP